MKEADRLVHWAQSTIATTGQTEIPAHSTEVPELPSRPEVIRLRRAVTVAPVPATPPADATAPADKLDLLVGVEAIADYLNIEVRQCFHWLARGYIPARKTGNIWIATRSALREHFSGSRRAAQ